MMSMLNRSSVMASLLLLLLCLQSARGVMPEHERMELYHARNYTWPTEYVPKNVGWKKLMDHRFRQAAEIEDRDKRYEAYVQLINSGLTAPNFTEYGFGLARAPDDLMVALRKGIRDGLENGDYELEGDIDVIYGDEPWFIKRPDLTERVLNEMQSYSETWVNMELTPYRAYGFRLYRNNSRLLMHIDRAQTHIVSFILHIDSSDDAEPWPIVIEDFNGNTHEVVLTSGDVLFYESSKCFHGRPHVFKGSWYSSVFVHYHPKYGWMDVDHDMEKHIAVPEHWPEQPTTHFEIPLEMVATGMTEPSCPNEWCGTEHSIKWSGPAKHGFWTSPDFVDHPFDPKRVVCEDSDEHCPEWAQWDSDECRTNAGFMLVNCKKSCNACTAAPITAHGMEL